MTECIYKIINKDGLYSAGGHSPHFTKKGKIWRTKGSLSNHFAALPKSAFDRYAHEGARVVTYHVFEHPVEECTVAEWKFHQDRRREKRTRTKAVSQTQFQIDALKTQIDILQSRLRNLEG